MSMDPRDNKAVEVSGCRDKELTEVVRRAPWSLEREPYYRHAWPYGSDSGEERDVERREGRASGTDLVLDPQRNFPKLTPIRAGSAESGQVRCPAQREG